MIKEQSSWHTWKGGRHVMKKGHVRVYCEDGKYRLEHRVIMEKHLGRSLMKNEVVHHINEIPDDNRLENLQVMTHAEHSALHQIGREYPKVPSTCHPERLVYKPGLCYNCKRKPETKKYNEKHAEEISLKRALYYQKNAEKIKARERQRHHEQGKKKKTPEQLARSRELYALTKEAKRLKKIQAYHRNKERTNPIRNEKRRKSSLANPLPSSVDTPG